MVHYLIGSQRAGVLCIMQPQLNSGGALDCSNADTLLMQGHTHAQPASAASLPYEPGRLPVKQQGRLLMQMQDALKEVGKSGVLGRCQSHPMRSVYPQADAPLNKASSKPAPRLLLTCSNRTPRTMQTQSAGHPHLLLGCLIVFRPKGTGCGVHGGQHNSRDG